MAHLPQAEQTSPIILTRPGRLRYGVPRAAVCTSRRIAPPCWQQPGNEVSQRMRAPIFVLNYNGRHLLEQCLGSVVAAAEASEHDCPVVVVDNSSTDDSLEFVRSTFPQVATFSHANVGLCSLNAAVAHFPGEAALLLNNDIRLAVDAVDPLLAPLCPANLGGESNCFFTAPQCWSFDGTTYEGFRTAVGWRWGLIQATARYKGYESGIEIPSWTASAGAALAVRRETFLNLGGFDSLYLPGRLEDVDLAYRGYLAGGHGRYIPASRAWHAGAASFGPAFGDAGCELLALRNTLLFQWKNLRDPWHLARQCCHLPVRLLGDFVRAPFRSAPRRFLFIKALLGAVGRRGQIRHTGQQTPTSRQRERRFFAMFHPRQMQRHVSTYTPGVHEQGSHFERSTQTPDTSRTEQPSAEVAS